MSDKPKILCLDDEVNVLAGFSRQLHKHFELLLSSDGNEALELLKSDGPFAVVLSDMRMPGLDGAEFLAQAKQVAPDTARIMLTGNNDQATAAAAVNDGEVFRFLNKPCSRDDMVKAITAGVEHHRLLKLEHELLHKTLMGSIQVMFDILSMTNPVAFSQTVRLKDYVLAVGKQLNVSNLWQLKVATVLAQIGCLTVPQALLERQQCGETLSEEEQKMVGSHYQVTQKLLQHIPRLEPVAEIISMQQRRVPLKKIDRATPVAFAAAVLQTVHDYDLHLYRGENHTTSLKKMKDSIDVYHPEILEALNSLKPAIDEVAVMTIPIADLKVNMVLAQDLKNKSGMLLVPKGFKINEAICQRLINYEKQGDLPSSEVTAFV